MKRLILAAACLVCLLAETGQSAVPSSITVHGRLTDAGGNPLPAGSKTFQFRIFNDTLAGAQIWPGGGVPEQQVISSNVSGLWVARVGAVSPLVDNDFDNPTRWLQITVDGTTLPRVRILSEPYAFRTGSVDGATGGGITSKVSIGPGHTNSGLHAFVSGEGNTVSGDWSTVAGGNANVASGSGATVGGGFGNQATGNGSTVTGGGSGSIEFNTASGINSTIGGGAGNRAAGLHSTVSGGQGDSALGDYSSVGGGIRNKCTDIYATVAGGRENHASNDYATIGGGYRNTAAFSSTVGGGQSNEATAVNGATIGGGTSNSASGSFSVIGGGYNNRTYGTSSVISGGGSGQEVDSNVARGLGAMIPGGTRNRANGNFSFAGGRRAHALHHGTFIWADSTDADFVSTGDDQFLIRASGGVGIGTNNPDVLFHVQDGSAGTVTGNNNSAAVFERNEECWLHLLSPDTTVRGILFGSPANALMGSIRFNPRGGGEEKGYEIRGRNNNILVEIDSLGNLHARGNLTAVGTCCASDERLKHNIRSLAGGLDKITCLRGVSYEWKPDETGERIFPSGEQIGLIAQEVQKVVPQAVNEDEDGYLAVDYTRLVPLLIEGMKEQQLTIEELKERLARLESRP